MAGSIARSALERRRPDGRPSAEEDLGGPVQLRRHDPCGSRRRRRAGCRRCPPPPAPPCVPTRPRSRDRRRPGPAAWPASGRTRPASRRAARARGSSPASRSRSEPRSRAPAGSRSRQTIGNPFSSSSHGGSSNPVPSAGTRTLGDDDDRERAPRHVPVPQVAADLLEVERLLGDQDRRRRRRRCRRTPRSSPRAGPSPRRRSPGRGSRRWSGAGRSRRSPPGPPCGTRR